MEDHSLSSKVEEEKEQSGIFSLQWGQWVKEWLSGLKKKKGKKDFRVGDVVVVLSTKRKRGKWILGRISDA